MVTFLLSVSSLNFFDVLLNVCFKLLPYFLVFALRHNDEAHASEDFKVPLTTELFVFTEELHDLLAHLIEKLVLLGEYHHHLGVACQKLELLCDFWKLEFSFSVLLQLAISVKVQQGHQLLFFLLGVEDVLRRNPGDINHAFMVKGFLPSSRPLIPEDLEIFVEQGLVDAKRLGKGEVAKPQEADNRGRVVEDAFLLVDQNARFFLLVDLSLLFFLFIAIIFFNLLPSFHDVAELPGANLGLLQRKD